MSTTTRLRRRLTTVARLLVVPTALSFLVGCGSDHAAVSPESASLIPSAGETAYLAFSPDALRRAAKVLGHNRKEVSSKFDKKGGELQILEENSHKDTDDLEVVLAIPKGGLFDKTTITMAVDGNTLEDLVVAFEPGGLEFHKPALLTLKVGTDLVGKHFKEKEIAVYHIAADGIVEEADVLAAKVVKKRYVLVEVSIPGFSRYGLWR